jgi:hypothetical protein
MIFQASLFNWLIEWAEETDREEASRGNSRIGYNSAEERGYPGQD